MILQKMKEFSAEFSEMQKSAKTKQDKKVNKFDHLSEKLSEISTNLYKTFNWNLKNQKISIGKGVIADSPWITLKNDDPDAVFWPIIIFYPKYNGYTISICERTEELKVSKEGRTKILLRREELELIMLSDMENLNWANRYPEWIDLWKNKSWSRDESYIVAAPILKYYTFDTDVDLIDEITTLCRLYSIMKQKKEIKDFIDKDVKATKFKEKYSSKMIKVVNESFSFYKTKFSDIDFEVFEENNTNNRLSTINRQKHKTILDEKVRTGEKAEDLVVEYEKQLLIDNGKPDLAENVKKLETDGDGYDVLSFYFNGRPKKIEVKSSKNNSKTVYISIREWELFKNSESIIYYVTWNINDINIIEFNFPDIDQNNLITASYKVKFK